MTDDLRHVYIFGVRASDELYPASNRDQHEEGIGIEEIANFVGNGGELLIHLLSITTSHDNDVAVNGVRFHARAQAIVQFLLSQGKRMIEKISLVLAVSWK